MKRTGLFCIAIMLLAGCASPPPPIHQYLLRGDPVEAQGQINIRIRAGLGRVVLAPYLMGNTGIRIETESGQIQPAGRHQWAEPLDSGLRWFLREKIASELGNEVGGGLTDVQDWDYRIDLFVARMHGTMDGRAVLDATFIVRSMNSSAASSQYRFSKSLPLPQEGYAGVVDAQRELAQELGVMIAGALQERIEAADEAEATSSAGG
jgi:uncharacterized lipoprotein YmbA